MIIFFIYFGKLCALNGNISNETFAIKYKAVFYPQYFFSLTLALLVTLATVAIRPDQVSTFLHCFRSHVGGPYSITDFNAFRHINHDGHAAVVADDIRVADKPDEL